MERADLLLGINGKIFVGQGQAISDHAKPSCRVLVVGILAVPTASSP